MSTTAALALISATFVTGGFVYVLVMKLQFDEFKEVLMGAIRGVPVSVKTRSMFLYLAWSSYTIILIILGVVLSVINVKIAEYAIDPGIRPVAHLVAFVFGIGAVGPVLNGVMSFFVARSALRESPGN